ncbi:PAS domain-containing protein [Streptomyces sp. A7024]|uniref:PAS domain-containing protein n=1 Tax=Streptomyces coryli TaxID=1128680 RepID=A0A6G4UBW4_9ACTN|nr:PAS domain-containing protein [Streptomyces coryli]NGN69709.1 PAS domain-containing protein [Streptomyces coryli]
MSATRDTKRPGAASDDAPVPPPGRPDLLAALLDGMDAALCAFDAEGRVTHWNREAEHLLGWTTEEAVGRDGLAGWAVRDEDAEEIKERLLSAMGAPGRQVHEFALLTKDGRRVLVRTQSAGVRTAGGEPAGVYCAFSEVHAQIDLERSIALSEALFEDAAWGVVLVDADLRPAVANGQAARALRTGRSALLGRPLGELLEQGVEELESALQHVMAQGAPSAPADVWVAVRGEAGEPVRRRCWRSAFVRLASPLAEEPVPLGVGWLFQDITEAKLAEQEASVLRFRDHQLHRAGRAAAECEEPMEAATVYLDFALAGFADDALIDLQHPAAPDQAAAQVQLVRVAATPAAGPGPCLPTGPGGFPLRYPAGHPALQAVERGGSVRSSCGGAGDAVASGWAAARKWPDGSVHALCAVLRSRGRTLGVVTFLRRSSRKAFTRADAEYAEDVAVRVASALDLAELLG